MVKWIFAGLAVCLAVYLLAIAWTLNAYRFKITDPKDPGFKAENFRFEDYFLDEKIRFIDVKQKMFPVGTSKDFVERILVEKNGATVQDYSSTLKDRPSLNATSYYRYDYNPWWNPAYKIFGLLNGVMFDGALFPVFVYYDSNNKVVEVR